MHLFSVFSLRNRALIALVTIVVAVFGGISLTLLKQELVPSISYPQLFIVTAYPGASPAVVEDDVSSPIEDAIQAIPGLESTTATSSENVSNVTAAFSFDTDLATAEQKITTAINRIKSTLPDGVDPQVIQFSLSDFPIIQLAATSDLDPVELSDRLERLVVPELTRLDGVASVSVQGSQVEQVEIVPDQLALAAHGLTTQAIQSALQSNGVLIPAGSITEDGDTLNVQAGQRLGSAEDIAALPLIAASTVAGGEVVTIGDVASVSIEPQDATGYSRVDGKDALTLSVTKTSSGNTVAVSDEVLGEIDELADSVGGGTEFTVVFDQAPFISQSIESLAQEGLLGLAFAVIVILIFLLSIRSTLVTAVSIPTSVLITFIGMWASGYTLNIITLGGLTIAIGRVVDDSIVVIENIKRHLEFGEDKKTAILAAVREVAGAVTASTITTVAVFLPIGLVGEEVGELFRPFAMTVTIALASSLLVSLTIVPVLAYWFLGTRKRKGADEERRSTGSVGIVEERPSALQRAYLPVIRWTLKYPFVVLLLAILTLGGSLALIPQLQLNFIGSSGQNTLTISQTFDPGLSLDEQNEASKEVEEVLIDVPGVETVQTSVGSGGNSLQAAFGGAGSASYSLVTDPDADQEELKDEVQEALDALDGVGELAISASNGFGSSTTDITVRAATEEDLQEAVTVVEDGVAGLASVGEVTDNLAASLPYIAVVVDRAEAARHGLSEVQVGGLVMAAMNPSSIGQVLVEDRTLSIYIVAAEAPTTVEELEAFLVPTATGPVALGDLASIERTLGPATITTNQGVRTAIVSIEPATADVGSTTFEVQDALDRLELPAGSSVELGGVSAQMLDSFSQLGLALLAAILIVYVVMVATFRSLRQPLLLLVSVPFAATGAIVLQVLANVPLGVSSLIGVLMLVGIVVTNAIVLVDLVNQYRERGMDTRTAVEQGAARRLRPILMTAAATIFALVPLAIGITGHGGFISQPLAIIVIGGLISSTILTLIVLPVLYYLVEGRAERRGPRLAARREARAEAERVYAERQAARAAERAERERANAEAAAARLASHRAAEAARLEAKAAKRGRHAGVAASTAVAPVVPTTPGAPEAPGALDAPQAPGAPGAPEDVEATAPVVRGPASQPPAFPTGSFAVPPPLPAVPRTSTLPAFGAPGDAVPPTTPEGAAPAAAPAFPSAEFPPAQPAPFAPPQAPAWPWQTPPVAPPTPAEPGAPTTELPTAPRPEWESPTESASDTESAPDAQSASEARSESETGLGDDRED